MPSETALKRAKSAANRKKPGPRPTTQRVVTRSCRIPETAWEKYIERAYSLGVPPARVMTMLVEAFAAGEVELPGVRYVFEDKDGLDAQARHDAMQGAGSPSGEAAEEELEQLGSEYDADLEI